MIEIDPRWVMAKSTVVHYPARWAILKAGGRVWSTRPALAVRAYSEDPGPVATWFMADRELFPVADLLRHLEARRASEIVLVAGVVTILPGGRVTSRPHLFPAPSEWSPAINREVIRAGADWVPSMRMVSGGNQKSMSDGDQLRLWLD